MSVEITELIFCQQKWLTTFIVCVLQAGAKKRCQWKTLTFFALVRANKRGQQKMLTVNYISRFGWHEKIMSVFYADTQPNFPIWPISPLICVNKNHWPFLESVFFTDSNTRILVSRNTWSYFSSAKKTDPFIRLRPLGGRKKTMSAKINDIVCCCLRA